MAMYTIMMIIMTMNIQHGFAVFMLLIQDSPTITVTTQIITGTLMTHTIGV